MYQKAAKTLLAAILFFASWAVSCAMALYEPDIAGPDDSWVKEVIDGDTIVMADSRTVRLIGINTPETDMAFFEEAKQYLAYLLEDRTVRLEKDVSDLDRYGRLLRYVFADDVFVNLEMVRSGFANTFTVGPDVKYSELFLQAERQARDRDIGLWKRSADEEIVIDIHYDAEGDDRKNLNGEYVLLTNRSGQDIPIGGWSIKDSATHTFVFPAYVFASGQTIRVFTGKGRHQDGDFYFNSSTPIWNNDHDCLYLRDKQGLLIGLYCY